MSLSDMSAANYCKLDFFIHVIVFENL
jgi:hypothetical protein